MKRVQLHTKVGEDDFITEMYMGRKYVNGVTCPVVPDPEAEKSLWNRLPFLYIQPSVVGGLISWRTSDSKQAFSFKYIVSEGQAEIQRSVQNIDKEKTKAVWNHIDEFLYQWFNQKKVEKSKSYVTKQGDIVKMH